LATKTSDRFLCTGPAAAPATILFAHGAGGAMDTPWMNDLAGNFADAGLRLARFEFGYMAGRRSSGLRTPPPRAENLMQEYRDALKSFGASGPVIIGGKSMGGRVASMIADELFDAGAIAGLLCVGYPFHPPGKPENLRTAHLAELETPALICQGTRDQFGTEAEVATYRLSPKIEIIWLEDGNHDLTPRKKISGFSAADHFRTVAQSVASWVDGLAL
jgi:uncharacterized protein